MIRTASDIKQLGTILAVGAHPDDETFLAGGIMATAVRNGQPVICITATRGEAGSQDREKWPLETLGEVRTKELGQALGILGIPKHYVLDYPDGGCKEIPAKAAVNQIKACIERYQPDTILTFGPEGLTGHDDHAAVSLWVDKAVKELENKPTIYHAVHTKDQYDKYLKKLDAAVDVFFSINKPPLKSPDECDICYELPTDIQKLKYRAFTAMPSQTEKMFSLLDEKFMSVAFGTEAFIKTKGK